MSDKKRPPRSTCLSCSLTSYPRTLATRAGGTVPSWGAYLKGACFGEPTDLGSWLGATGRGNR